MLPAALGSVRGRGLLVLLGTSAALLISLAATGSRGMPPCLFHAVTGIPCASCGMTRAFLDLGHGRFLAALEHNLASPLVYAGAWALLVISLLQVLQGQERITVVWRKVKVVALPVMLGTLAVGWGYRLWQVFRP